MSKLLEIVMIHDKLLKFSVIFFMFKKNAYIFIRYLNLKNNVINSKRSFLFLLNIPS